MEKSFFDQFNQLPEITDGARAQDYEIAKATRWLDAAQEYNRSEDHSLPENSTEQAFFDGTIERGGLEMIENNLRDLSIAVFRDQMIPKPEISNEERLVQNENMAYFETWLMMKEQVQNGNFDKNLTQNFLLAKKLFAEACRHYDDADRSTHRELIDQASDASEELLIQLRTDPEHPASLPFTYASLKMMKARIIHDMAIDGGAYDESQKAANFMAIESLWESAEEIAELEDGLLPDWAKTGYLDEIKYFRRLYSAESGLDENIRPSYNKQEKLSTLSSDFGTIAVKDSVRQPRAA